MTTNKLFLTHTKSKKKICLSKCYGKRWYVDANFQKKFDEFFCEIEPENRESGKENYSVEYEHPFLHTPKKYQENYLRRIILSCHVNSLDQQKNKNTEPITEELIMNFQEAIVAAKAGAHLSRPSWDINMYMWWQGSYCVHTHPYFDYQVKSPSLTGYFYVCEKDDASAGDWMLVGA